MSRSVERAELLLAVAFKRAWLRVSRLAPLLSPVSHDPLLCCSAKASGMLYPHQIEGVRWLWSLHCLGSGGILADDMVSSGGRALMGAAASVCVCCACD